jgi:gas vesicle protein
MSRSENMATTTLAFIAGVGAGIAAGVLFAPRSGEETREQLKKKAQETKEKAHDKMEQERKMLKKRAEQVKSKAQKVASDSRAAVEDAADDIKQRANERATAED